MVHIKDDRRAAQSAERLYGALMACLQEKPFADITVTELVERADVGRSTFYRNFDEPADVLWWKCGCRFDEFFCGYLQREDKSAFGMMEYGLSFWQTYWELLALIISIGRMDIIFDGFERNIPRVLQTMPEHAGILESQQAYFSAVHSGIFLGVCKVWIENGRRENGYQLAAVIRDSVFPFATAFENKDDGKAL